MIVKMLKSMFKNRPSEKRTAKTLNSFRPVFELLESRCTPATFSWTNAGGIGVWEQANNWFIVAGAAGMAAFPGFDGAAATTNDIALFRPMANANVTMQASKELAQLQVLSNVGNIVLRGQLTLNNGGELAVGANIIQRTAMGNGPIVLSGGTFVWRGSGNINFTDAFATNASTFTVRSVGIFLVQTGNVSFGSDLVIESGGEMELRNQGTVTLRNRPTITNAGEISISASEPRAIQVPAGDPASTISNNGIIRRIAGVGTYGIANPVSNTGTIDIDSGILQFSGTDLTAGASVINQGGTIVIHAGQFLHATAGLKQTSGTISAPDADQAFLTGNLVVQGGVIYIGSATGQFDVSGDFTFSSGTLRVAAARGAMAVAEPFASARIRVGGTTGATVTAATTVVELTLVGVGVAPRLVPVIWARRPGTSTINAEPDGAPAGYQLNRTRNFRANDTLILVPNPGAGAGAAQINGILWDDLDNNGLQDTGEPGVEGATVFLLDDVGNVIGVNQTNSTGTFVFQELDAGDYQIQVFFPADYSFAIPNSGNDDALDSDVNSIGVTSSFSLTASQVEGDIDVGLVSTNAPPSFSEGIVAVVDMSEDASPTAFTLTLNASDPNNDTLTWSIDVAASNGTASVSGTGTSKSISFTPTANYFGGDFFDLKVDDGNGGAAVLRVIVNIEGINDAPVIVVPNGQAINEDNVLTFSSLNWNEISIADPDADEFYMEVTLTASHGVLSLASSAGLVFGAGSSNGNSSMTFVATKNQINIALNGLTFTPDANYSGSAAVQIDVDDLAGGTDSETVVVTINPVNDAPVNTVPGPQTTNEDTNLVFSAANGNAISISDIDAGSAAVQVSLSVMMYGTLTLSGTSGLSFSSGDGSADSYMTFTGGGAMSDYDTVNITVSPVNDAPVLGALADRNLDGRIKGDRHV